jgi:hypothetical protein
MGSEQGAESTTLVQRTRETYTLVVPRHGLFGPDLVMKQANWIDETLPWGNA